MPAECSSEKCMAPIDWATYRKRDGSESSHPVDHDSAGAEDGKLAVWRDPETGVLWCRFLTQKEPLNPEAGEKRGRSHYQTCPDRGRFRRAGAR
jgi:hypothetical protein